MNHCDICRKNTKEELFTIKWPAVDTHMQYQEVCEKCTKSFYSFKKSSGKDRTIFSRFNKHYEKKGTDAL